MRDRVARMKTLLRRALGFWKGVFLLMIIGFVAAYFSMINTKRTYKSECKVVLKRGIKTGNHNEEGDSKTVIRAKLKEMTVERARLEGAIKKFKLYPSVVNGRGLLAATQEMKLAVGFRASESNFFDVSFEYPEQPDGQTQELVRMVTQYLAETLVSDFTKTNTTEAQRNAEFAEEELKKTQAAFDTSNRDFVVFLDTHPKYLEAMQKMASANGPLPGTAGAASAKPYTPLIALPGAAKNPADAKWQAIFERDPDLKRLYGERNRLIGEIPRPAAQPAAPQGPSKDALAAASERVNTTKAAVASACGHGLTAEHPDFAKADAPCKAARSEAATAVTNLSALNAQKAAAEGASAEPDSKSIPPELRAKLDGVGGQIAKREAQLKKEHAGDTTEDAGATAAPTASVALPAGDPRIADEQEFQRLMQSQKDAKVRLDDKQRAYDDMRSKAAAAESKASEIMAVVEPAYRPNQATKGRGQSFIMVSVVGLILALAYAAARVLFNDRIIDQGDLEALGVIPVLGVVPQLPHDNERGSKKVKVARANE